MNFTDFNCIPDSSSMLLAGSSKEPVVNGFLKKFTPLDAGGGYFDFTQMVSANFHFSNNQSGIAYDTVDKIPTVVANDNTGITVSLSQADLLWMIQSLKSSKGQYSLIVYDDTSKVVAGAGSWSFTDKNL